jgi:hypothetical protein
MSWDFFLRGEGAFLQGVLHFRGVFRWLNRGEFV